MRHAQEGELKSDKRDWERRRQKKGKDFDLSSERL